MLEMLKLEVDAKERSLTITGSNFNNDRTTFHQPDFTTSVLSNLATKKSACIAAYLIISLISDKK